MIRTLIRYFLFPLLVFLLARSFLRSTLAGLRRPHSGASAAPGASPVQFAGDLKRDPVCGTYVSTAVSVKRSVGGQVIHFCSSECRDRYRP
jgi:YHS domain-containing protein